MSEELVLLSDDDSSIRLVASKALEKAGYIVKTSENLNGLLALIEKYDATVLVTDIVYPDGDALDLLPEIQSKRPNLNIIMMSARSTLITALKTQESDVFAYLPKPFSLEKFVETVSEAFQASKKKDLSSSLPIEEKDQSQLIGKSAAMQGIFRLVARLVSSDLSVLITGESGTGKEVVAKVLHDLGKRKNMPFVALNMAAIPKDLIESELFGHEKGAFTGADRRSNGRFEQAKEGTLFLDEIGDMPAETQTRLLRVLQDGCYTRVGGNELITSNARIIAATNQNLLQLISQGKFREDLYYRLNVVPLELPPLRERKDDIFDLVQHFLSKAATEGLPKKQFSNEAILYLQRYYWPGNVRELENVIKRALIVTDDEIISAKDIQNFLKLDHDQFFANANQENTNFYDAINFHIGNFFNAHDDELPASGLYERIISDVEKPLIEKTLEITNGNQIKASEILGLNRNTLRKKIVSLNISITSAKLKNINR